MRKLHVILILSILAFFNASYLTWHAFEIRAGQGEAGFCDISTSLSCSNVLAAPQAWIGSIPFPAVALVVYPVLAAIAIWGFKRRRSTKAYDILAYLAGAGILFNSYFIFTEALVIKAFCILCLLCTAMIITIFILSLMGRKAD